MVESGFLRPDSIAWFSENPVFVCKYFSSLNISGVRYRFKRDVFAWAGKEDIICTHLLSEGRSLAGDSTGEKGSQLVKQLTILLAFRKVFALLAGQTGALLDVSQFKVKNIPFFGVIVHWISSLN